MSKQSIDRDLKKGSAELLILSLLETRQRHGYEISKLIETRSKGTVTFRVASLYPLLYRLEDRGWVSSYWGASENNRKAKFYRLTAAGRKRLVRETTRWRQMARAIALVMGEETLSGGDAA